MGREVPSTDSNRCIATVPGSPGVSDIKCQVTVTETGLTYRRIRTNFVHIAAKTFKKDNIHTLLKK